MVETMGGVCGFVLCCFVLCCFVLCCVVLRCFVLCCEAATRATSGTSNDMKDDAVPARSRMTIRLWRGKIDSANRSGWADCITTYNTDGK